MRRVSGAALSGCPIVIVLLLLTSACGPAEEYTVDPAATGDLPPTAGESGWPRWGGPRGDFVVSASGLAPAWPDPPPQLWSRELGEGYSSVVASGDLLVTMYRDGDDDVVIALRADDGSQVWEHRYPAPTHEGNTLRFGKGPNATPLALEDRVVTFGYTGILKALALDTGEELWSHDVIADLEGEVLQFGSSASPIAHDGKVLVLVGGDRGAVVAFEPADGSVAWRSGPGTVSYATPVVIDVDGSKQIVYLSADEVIGLAAADGGTLWRHPCENQYRNNATDPIWGDDNLLWVATQLDGGTRMLRLSADDGRAEVDEVWSNNKVSIHFWNALRLGDHVYASIGSNASILACVDVKTGEIVWRERGFEQVNFVQAGEQTILLDANGNLALVTLTPEGLTVHAQYPVVDGVTWTPPTLVGTTLYIRDKQSIRALDLSAAAFGGDA